MQKISTMIDGFVNAVGAIARMLVFVLMGVIAYEAIARYFFGAPTSWAYDLSGWLLVFYVFLGGGYALLQGGFVRVDIVFQKLSKRTQFWLDATIASFLVLCFTISLMWHGGTLALKSFNLGEVSSSGGWGGPVWPAKFAVPFGAFLVLIAWVSHLAKRHHANKEAE